MTPTEYTKKLVEQYAKPIGDPDLLMFWNWKGHATRLLIQSLVGVLGEGHPLGLLLQEYEKADIIASKIAWIDDDDVFDLDRHAANISAYAEDVSSMIGEWEDGISNKLNEAKK